MPNFHNRRSESETACLISTIVAANPELRQRQCLAPHSLSSSVYKLSKHSFSPSQPLQRYNGGYRSEQTYKQQQLQGTTLNVHYVQLQLFARVQNSNKNSHAFGHFNADMKAKGLQPLRITNGQRIQDKLTLDVHSGKGQKLRD